MKRIALLVAALAIAAVLAVVGAGLFTHQKTHAAQPARRNWGPPVTAAMVEPAPVYWAHPVTNHG